MMIMMMITDLLKEFYIGNTSSSFARGGVNQISDFREEVVPRYITQFCGDINFEWPLYRQ